MALLAVDVNARRTQEETYEATYNAILGQVSEFERLFREGLSDNSKLKESINKAKETWERFKKEIPPPYLELHLQSHPMLYRQLSILERDVIRAIASRRPNAPSKPWK